MTVSAGSPVNASNTNAAYVSRTANTDLSGTIDLLNSGSDDINDLQSVVNDLLDDFDTSTGHDHDGTDSKKVVATNLDTTGGNADQVLVANGSGGATWEDQSGGSGTGGFDIYGTLDADTDDYTDFDTTNLTNATFGEESTTPLSGSKSYLLTNVTGSVGEYLISPAQTVQKRSRDKKTNSVKFPYIYDGDDGDLKAIFYDETNSEVIAEVELEAASTTKTLILDGHVSSTTMSASLRIEVLVVNNGKKLIFDDVVFTDDPFVYKDILDEQIYSLQQAGNAVTNRAGEVEFNLGTATITNSGDDLITADDDSGNTRTKFIANRDCTVDISWGATISSTGNITYIYKNGSIIQKGATNYSSNLPSSVSAELELSSGEYFSVGTSQEIGNNTDINYLTFNAKAMTEHIVTPAKAGSQTIRYDGFSVMSSNRVKFLTRQYNQDAQRNDNDVLFTDDNTTFTKITAIKDCLMSVSAGCELSTTANFAIQLVNDSDVVQYTWQIDPQTGGYATAVPAFVNVPKDWYIQAFCDGTPNNTASQTFLNVMAVPTQAEFLAAIPNRFGKQYSEADGDFTVTGSNSWTTVHCTAIPYQTENGIWRMKFNFTGSAASSFSAKVLTVTGVTFKNITNFNQAVTASTSVGVGIDHSYAVPNTGTIDIDLAAVAGGIWAASGDVELESKPTWAD